MTDLSHFLAERLAALRAVRLHRAEREECARMDAANERLSREVVAYHVLAAFASGVPGVALALSLAWVYVAGGGLLERGAITLGTFVAFVLYQGRLFGPANGLVALMRQWQEARVSVERVAELLARPPVPVAQDEATSDAALALEDVTFAYPGKPPVFERVNLSIAPGERVALLGVSGTGKSTLVQLLFGLREPQHGRVVADGGSPRDPARAAALAYAGAEPFLLHATVLENIRYGRTGASGRDVARAAALAEAHAFVEALPQGYMTVVGGRGLALSDGQRQRIGLARALLREAPVLVLDEAFSALDLETEARVRANVLAAFPRCTLLVITHRPTGLDAFDRVLALRGGRFVELRTCEVPTLAPAA